MPYRSLRRQWHEVSKEWFTKIAQVGNSRTIPEWTLNNKIHLHAICQIGNKLNYHKIFKPWLTKQGFHKVEEIKSFDNVHRYILKEASIACTILNQNMPVDCYYYKNCGCVPCVMEAPDDKDAVKVDDCYVEDKQDVSSPRV